jgi:basic membrane protein A
MSRKTLTRRDALKTGAGAAGLIGLAGCSGGGGGGGGGGGSGGDTINAAFIYQAEVGDVGWDRAHEDARQAVT